MRVLLIEDDERTSRSIEMMLSQEKISVYTSAFGEDGIDLAKIYEYDLVLLDLTLPDMSGYEVLSRLRTAKVDTPVLILTGDDNAESKLRGFKRGADDYITKPFQSDELVARIRAIVRRSQGHAQAIIEVGPITVDTDQKTVSVGRIPISLTAKEYDLLELLALRNGTTLAKDTILNHLYGGIDEPEIKIIDVFICKLRKKLSVAENAGQLIETAWGRGYSLRAQQEKSGHAA